MTRTQHIAYCKRVTWGRDNVPPHWVGFSSTHEAIGEIQSWDPFANETWQPVSSSVLEFALLSPFFGQNIYAFADNYKESTTINGARPAPHLFIKPVGSFAPSQAVVPIGDLVDRGAKIWGESEIALVIGQGCRPIGVTLANDITMEMPGFEGQDHHLPYFKGQPSFCPVADAMISLDVLERYELLGFHNGELLRKGTQNDQIYSWQELIDWLGGWAPLQAGDLILMGAPRRVRSRLYLKPGDTYTARLNDGALSLENHFS